MRGFRGGYLMAGATPMNIGVWVLIGFLSGFLFGVAVDRIGFWLRPVGDQPVGDQQEESQIPPQAPPFGDTGSSLPPFPRLRRPPR